MSNFSTAASPATGKFPRVLGAANSLSAPTRRPDLRAKELVTRTFGQFDPEDSSRAASAFFCCEQLLAWMGLHQMLGGNVVHKYNASFQDFSDAKIQCPITRAETFVKSSFGDFVEGDGSDADLAYKVCEQLIDWLGDESMLTQIAITMMDA